NNPANTLSSLNGDIIGIRTQTCCKLTLITAKPLHGVAQFAGLFVRNHHVKHFVAFHLTHNGLCHCSCPFSKGGTRRRRRSPDAVRAGAAHRSRNSISATLLTAGKARPLGVLTTQVLLLNGLLVG